MVALIGPCPPPYGGVAIHVQRLKEQLVASGWKCVVYDLVSQREWRGAEVTATKNARLWPLRYFFTASENIIHYIYSGWEMGVLVGVMRFLGKKAVVSIVGDDLKDHLTQGGWFRKKLLIFALKRYARIIAVNPEIERLLLSKGISPERIEVITPFLPPAVNDETKSEVTQEIWHFIDGHKPVISANAFKIRFYNGTDLYGLDMCIELCAKLKSTYPEIGFVFCLPDIGDHNYFEKMKQEIRDKDIENNFLLVTQPLGEVYPIWQKSDVFVRPTNTDGDSVSLREALYLKTPSVASDVISRPEGTVLFKNRDIDSFTESVEHVLRNHKQLKADLESLEIKSGLSKILEVYRDLLK